MIEMGDNMSITIITPLPLYIFFMVCAVTVFLYAFIHICETIQSRKEKRLRRRRHGRRWAL